MIENFMLFVLFKLSIFLLSVEFLLYYYFFFLEKLFLEVSFYLNCFVTIVLFLFLE